MSQTANTYCVFLVEDISGEIMLKIILDKIGLKAGCYEIHHYKGIGRIPKNLKKTDSDPKKRQLLSQLPRLLTGFTNRYQSVDYAMFVLCDLDERCFKEFRQELLKVAHNCKSQARTHFIISVKEMEAWFLGDFDAIKKIYPLAKQKKKYKESNHGNWETLADAIKKGWSKDLHKQKETEGYYVVGKLKNQWAKEISPHLDVERNQSPCFCYFREKILKFLNSDKVNQQ
ncbi:hypothetical protein FACS189427_07640 [Planctomycetales bacterium]|nr:hypothetical protein FACS189427_07640 [Planctomycetales bacterium]